MAQHFSVGSCENFHAVHRSASPLKVKNGFALDPKLAPAWNVWKCPRAQPFLGDLFKRQIGVVKSAVVELADTLYLFGNRACRPGGFFERIPPSLRVDSPFAKRGEAESSDPFHSFATMLR